MLTDLQPKYDKSQCSEKKRHVSNLNQLKPAQAWRNNQVGTAEFPNLDQQEGSEAELYVENSQTQSSPAYSTEQELQDNGSHIEHTSEKPLSGSLVPSELSASNQDAGEPSEVKVDVVQYEIVDVEEQKIQIADNRPIVAILSAEPRAIEHGKHSFTEHSDKNNLYLDFSREELPRSSILGSRLVISHQDSDEEAEDKAIVAKPETPQDGEP